MIDTNHLTDSLASQSVPQMGNRSPIDPFGITHLKGSRVNEADAGADSLAAL